jgi:hypothetical protein
MAFDAIDFMPIMGDCVIDRFAHAVDHALEPMLGDRVSGRQREVLAKSELLGRGEDQSRRHDYFSSLRYRRLLSYVRYRTD